MKSFKLKCAFFMFAVVVLNGIMMFSETEAAKGDTTFMAGLVIKDPAGKVIGCDCPVMRGACICKVTALP